MYLVIIILPLLGSIVSGFFGRKVGVSGAQFITCFSVIVTTILAIIALCEVGFNNIPVSIELFRWIDSEWINIMVAFEFDSLTVSYVIANSNKGIYAVLVKIPLSRVVFLNKFFFGSGSPIPTIEVYGNKTGMVHFNNKSQNRFLYASNKYLLPKRCFSNITVDTVGITQSLSEEKPLKYSDSSNIVGDVDWENFIQWFVGFSDAEANFIINSLLKKDKVTISRFSFMFKIALHKDDADVLGYIHKRLAIGNVRFYNNECIFNVTDRAGIELLVSIFDKYNLNTTKYLDYLYFIKAVEFMKKKKHIWQKKG